MPHTQGDAERRARTDVPDPAESPTTIGRPAEGPPSEGPTSAVRWATSVPERSETDLQPWESTPVAGRLAGGTVAVVLALVALGWAGFRTLHTGGYPYLEDLGGHAGTGERLFGVIVIAAVLALLAGLGFLAHGLFVLGRRSDVAVGAYIGGEPWWEGHPTPEEPADLPGSPGAGSPARH